MHGLTENDLYREVGRAITGLGSGAAANLDWLMREMDPYFLIAMQREAASVASLAAGLGSLGENRRLLLANRDKTLILARLNLPGSLYDTLRTLQEREISYAQFTRSSSPLPGIGHELEVQRFDFDRKEHAEISRAGEPAVPKRIRKEVLQALAAHYPLFDTAELDRLLGLLWLNNEQHIRLFPARRTAQILWIFQRAIRREGICLEVEEAEREETRVMFAVGDPPESDFLVRTMEVFNRLGLGVGRAYCLTISNGTHPYFLGIFYVGKREEGESLRRGSQLFLRLQKELYNIRILSSASEIYREFVAKGVMTGEEGSLVNALISFCHTNLARHRPDQFGYEDVIRAFHSHPEIALRLTALFRVRFEPGIEPREERFGKALEETEKFIKGYNTGHRYIDDVRRAVFGCAVDFIRHTLKTNFFVAEKQALAFRLDPAYLAASDAGQGADLPPETPFRITFFFGRYGAGYHIGFSDIARGGWRTIVTGNRDDYVTCAAGLFREVYVLAHTQHLKNKDIYEGGSKMVTILDAGGLQDREQINQRLYTFQFGLINAFLDIFVTEKGKARDPRVVDYYGEDEPIELGPDENMHDVMIEAIARQSLKRGYLLGIGIMSGKRVGINHKDYGVTSAGVVKFAEITMKELGIDIGKEPFSVKFTGGPNGDVAGNAMRLLMERCPRVKIKLILDGTGAVFDPEGMRHEELGRILLKDDLDAFDPAALHPGSFILYRHRQRTEGLRELFKRVVRTGSGVEEQWVTADEFHREFGNLLFSVPTDLFIPAGGRPETIDKDNWERFLREDGTPTTRVIVEGANSFITPEARVLMQRRGIVIMRDSSANKCGVISSSYEIIANLLLTEEEYLANKERYVADVIEMLEKRAEDEALLIFRRQKEPGCSTLCTEISEAISQEINALYARLFDFFQRNPLLCEDPLFHRAVLGHLPRMLRDEPTYNRRVRDLPAKYLFAILAAELASSIIYRGDREADFEETLKGHLKRRFAR